jgi:RNA-dependent RNA polymerase
MVMVKKGLLNKSIEIRPSMKKFESDHSQLEVIRCATYSNGYLNRQVISLLNC